MRISKAIAWADCDHSRVVLLPNFVQCLEAATEALFDKVGASWKDLIARYGISGLPLISTECRFHKPVQWQDRIEIETYILDWDTTSFRVGHRVFRAGDLIAEATDERFWGLRDQADHEILTVGTIPEEVKSLFRG